MANFLFVYRGNPEADAKLTPDEMQKVMQKWTDWIGEGFAKGWLVNAGDALTMEGKVVHCKQGRDRRTVRRIQGDRRRLFDRAGRHDRRPQPSSPRVVPGCSNGGKVEVRALAGLA